jgi:hypothetical protein
VSGFSTTVYDSTGTPVPGDEEFGGVSEGADGTVLLGVGLPYGMAPGTYTVGFSVTDAGGLTTSYGPGGRPVPGDHWPSRLPRRPDPSQRAALNMNLQVTGPCKTMPEADAPSSRLIRAERCC